MDDSKKSSLTYPLARVKKIVRLDSEIKQVSNEAVVMITRAAEIFTQYLAEESFKHTLQSKKRTVTLEHLRSAVDDIPDLWFLQDELSDETSFKAKKQKTLPFATCNGPQPPTKPPSGFFLYMAEKRDAFASSHPEMKASEISSALGKQWNECSEEEREKFTELSHKLKADYEVKLAEYYKALEDETKENEENEENEEDNEEKAGQQMEDDDIEED
eukprot:GCRY01004662.1.p1 GENE.GCRY01004662.1~~GCRY01004662.1.p1  ORF type:complete len:216 (+),score=36.58 GCRY01004662.1:131-778(+)